MSLMNFYPHKSGRSYWDVWDWPPRLGRQDFGLDLSAIDDWFGQRFDHNFDRNIGGVSEVTNDGNKFEIKLDCNQFRPEELEVRTVGDSVVIHGKHSEKDDSSGHKSWISREFSRRYTLPTGCEAQEVVSSLEPNGVLKISAPKHEVPQLEDRQRSVPIAVQNGGNTERKAISNGRKR